MAVVLTVIPIALYLVQGEPVALLKLAGADRGCPHPRRRGAHAPPQPTGAPRDLQPSATAMIATSLAAAFFAIFAVVYVAQVVR